MTPSVSKGSPRPGRPLTPEQARRLKRLERARAALTHLALAAELGGVPMALPLWEYRAS